jgi:glycosyltransferase involved in cell wall biosynthesis
MNLKTLVDMNILWLSHLLPYPPKNGASQRSYHLIRQAALKNKVDLVAFNQNSLVTGKENIAIAIAEFSKFCDDVHVIPIPCEEHQFGEYVLAAKSLFSVDPYNINWLKSIQMHKLLQIKIAKKKYDIVWYDTISLVPYVRYSNSKKTVLNHHNIESDMMFRRALKERNPFLKSYFFQEGFKLRFSERKYCPQFSLNVTCSELDSHRMLQRYPDLKTSVIPNGVDVEFFKPSFSKSSNNSLIFAGDLSWYPNREAMLYFANKIWPLLKTRIPDIQMTVIGKNPPKALLKLSLTDKNFMVTGFVGDVRPFISQASVYVCPIMNGGGTKLKIIDALAMGKAIVAHPIACEGIDVTDGKDVLFATTPESFTSKICSLLDNVDKRDSMGHNGRMLAEQVYTYERIGQKLNNEFERLCSL